MTVSHTVARDRFEREDEPAKVVGRADELTKVDERADAPTGVDNEVNHS